ncbi:tyrosine-type recombinase/integrase [Clostridium sp. 19966]|uniref:tyrosine-type recombinase/integrase n=1 Tax=Clostridium sp. 19966 TaxID=2768166 RepID=UPI0028DFA829|nr:tyrosine-type recombinase/integrase [Clostridium sp. 19966]MDT8718200.1 tyrosine-type recombinase/integrase [Clostridium sp. 19966]
MEFVDWLAKNGNSKNTIKSYDLHIRGYKKWFSENYGKELSVLYRNDIQEYIKYLKDIKNLKPRSINAKISALDTYNKYLIEEDKQRDRVIFRTDLIKVEKDKINSSVHKEDVDNFRQMVLNNSGERNFAIVTLIAYSGIKISEALDIRISNVHLAEKEIIIIYENSTRVIVVNNIIIDALNKYMEIRSSEKFKDSDFLFISNKSSRVNRTIINKLFNKYSKDITPNLLRGFFIKNALEKGWSTNEVAAQIGDSSVLSSPIYTLPSMEDMKNKAELL